VRIIAEPGLAPLAWIARQRRPIPALALDAAAGFDYPYAGTR